MTESVQLAVTGMKCGGCETNVTGKLKAVAGVSAASATFKDNSVTIEYDTNQTDLDALKKVITEAGFTVDPK